MDENTVATIRQILGLPEGEAIPARVQAAYRKFKLMNDRINAGRLSQQMLVMVCFVASEQAAQQPTTRGFDPEEAIVMQFDSPPEKPENPPAPAPAPFKEGDKVQVEWEGRNIKGVFLAQTAEGLVEFRMGNGHVRTVDPAKVQAA